MSKFYFFVVLSVAVLFRLPAEGQSVLNPADTIVNFTSTSTLPAMPAANVPGKWGRTPSLTWNTTEYKCYIINGNQFRLHYPLSYKPGVADGKLYPMLMFMHGAGEVGGVRDNETELYHGAQFFQTETDNGTFDGYVVCMQDSTGEWEQGNWAALKVLMDYMITNNKLDPFRITLNGLSAGGESCWNMFYTYPTYFAGSWPMSNISTVNGSSSDINLMKFTPWIISQGGQDQSPAPYTAQQVSLEIEAAGANYSEILFPTQGHDTWDSTWELPNFFPFVIANYTSNPWPLTGRTLFCPGQSINVTMGVVPGFTAYQWSLNGSTISGATSNTLTVTAVGTYACRVEKGTTWSLWSPTPVVIQYQVAGVAPAITQTNPLQSLVLPAPNGQTSIQLGEQTGDSLYSWYKLGSNTVLGTLDTLTVSQTGDYVSYVVAHYGCVSNPSPSFEVVNANGPNPPPAATAFVANPGGNTWVNLSWSQIANPPHAATGTEIYRGTSATGPFTFVGLVAPSVVTYKDSSLSAGTAFYYELRNVDTAGASPLTAVVKATTFRDTIPPSAPTGLAIGVTNNTSIGLTWNAATDNVGVDHYLIFINGVRTYETTTTSIICTALTQGQLYDFTVEAVDAAGNTSVLSNQVDGAAVLNGLTFKYYTSTNAPSSVTNIATMTQIATGSTPNTNINLYTGTTTTNFAYVWTGYVTIPKTGTYYFATNSDDGSALWFNSLTPTGTATVNNDGLHGTQTVTSAALNLTAGTYPICIEYFQAGGGYAMTTYWASTALYGNTTLVAIPNSAFAAPYTIPGNPPNKPTLVTATVKAYNKVGLTWQDNSNNETGFEVYRSTVDSGNYQIITTTGPNVTSFTDSGSVKAATRYFYRVQAINQYGGSGYDSLSVSGLLYKFYLATLTTLPDYDTLTPAYTGYLNNYSLAPAGSTTVDFGFKYTGFINIPTTGTYTFYTSSDDASNLYIGTYNAAGLVVNNNYQQGQTQRSGTIALTAGVYPIYVAYNQGGGGYALTVSWQGPGIAQSYIPDSAFYNKVSSIVTPALPAKPVTPSSFAATILSASKLKLTWTDTSSAISSYTINRSFGDSLHFNPLGTAYSASYSDSGLLGHQQYYYSISASGPGGTSATSPALGAVTLDNFPVVTNLPNVSMRYDASKTINFSATDADGDAIAFSGSGLPSFVTLTDNGNGTGYLTITAGTASNIGSYPIGVAANDNHGGITTSSFTLNINNFYTPVITPISNTTVNEGAYVSIPMVATDQNPADVLAFTATGYPSGSTLVAGPNGSDTLKVHPNYGAAGTYKVAVTVTDQTSGQSVVDTFQVVVKFVSPSAQQIYVQFSSGDLAGAPWNSVTGDNSQNLLDANGNQTTVNLQFQTTWWYTAPYGPVTGNNSGVYPDNVEKDYFFFAIYGAPNTITVNVAGLDPTQVYNLTFYAGSVWTGESNNGTTIYTAQGQSASLAVQNNTQNTVTLSNLVPNSSGVVSFVMSEPPGNPLGYLNALVISKVLNDGTKPLTPSTLTLATTAGGAVQMNWIDSAYNELGYQIFRSTTAAGPFTQLTPNAPSKATTYTDSTVLGYTKYYYEVEAYNAAGTSNFSNLDSITTPDKVPSLTAIPNVTMGFGAVDTVQIVTTGSGSNNHVTLSASNLPNFAAFTDNGNGTGNIVLTPPLGTTGSFQNLTVTATDQADSIRSTAFSVYIKDTALTSYFINFGDATYTGSFPWNNYTNWPAKGYYLNNLVNDNGTTTNVNMVLKTGFAGNYEGGMQPDNGQGIYPDAVSRVALFETAAQTDTIQITNLPTNKYYNVVIFSSVDQGLAAKTNFTVSGQTVTVDPQYNINKTVEINHVTPDVNGNIFLGVAKASGANYAYVNTVIIQQYGSNVNLIEPSTLVDLGSTRTTVGLQWADQSWNETGFEIWRGTDSAGIYTKLTTVPANTTSYTDTGLTSNKNYYYTVRAVINNGGVLTESKFSNPVSATTYAYSVSVSYNDGTNIPAPWNNMPTEPQTGYVSTNFFDDKGQTTSIGQVLTGAFAGSYYGGMNTGNNSGIVPDLVLEDSYYGYQGSRSSLTLNGLDMSLAYDVTVLNSINGYGDFNTLFIANGKTALLNATLNTKGELTIKNVQPDQNGKILLQVLTGDAGSQGAVINALVLSAHNPVGTTVPPPDTVIGEQNNSQLVNSGAVTTDATADPNLSNQDTIITALPNPFSTFFLLMVPASNGDKVQVTAYDEMGRNLYGHEFEGMSDGVNVIRINTPNSMIEPGIYFVRVQVKGKPLQKVLKLVKLQ